MVQIPVAEVEARWRADQQARNCSPKKVERYHSTFLDFTRFLVATGRPETTASLSAETLGPSRPG